MRSDYRTRKKLSNLILRIAISVMLIFLLMAVFYLYNSTPSDSYNGDLKDGLPHGFGLWKHSSGVYYAGEFFEGVWQGRGTWIHPDGIKYAGYWLSGEYHGRGTLLLPSGSRYDGEWAGGKKEGPGIYLWPDGKTYSGWWANDRHEGYGVMQNPAGFSYKGWWHDGYRQGQGHAVYLDGSEYHGQWFKDKRHGTGIMVLPDGTIYESSWHYDEQHGEGTVTSPDGTIEAAVWLNGRLQEITIESMTLDPERLTLVAGGATATIIAEIYPNDATIHNITWESSNPEVASVTGGVVRPLSPGIAVITATTVVGEQKAYCTVTVGTTAILVTSVNLDRTSITLRVGETATLIATVSPSQATNTKVNWTSSDSTIAAVYQETGRRGGVSALSPGEVFITVRTIDGRHTAQCQVTILPKEDPANQVINPRFIGKSINEAREMIAAAGLAVGDVRSEYHPTAPPDQVISQNPAVGASVNKGSLVNLVISRGPEPVSEPEPNGNSEDENGVLIPQGDGD